MKLILIHGSGHRTSSWNKTIDHMRDMGLDQECELLCPELSELLRGREASYENLCESFSEYCAALDGELVLCGLSLGGILALDFAAHRPEKVSALVLMGTPYKVPKAAFRLQNMIYRFLPASMFKDMAFDKKDTFILGASMKDLDLSQAVQDIKCPSLIICGERDRANLKSAYILSEKIGCSRIEIIKSAGHVLNEEVPKELASLIAGFLMEQK